MATVKLTSGAAKQLDRLQEPTHGRVLKVLKRLESWPGVSGVKALSGNLAGWYRARAGDHRVRFRVDGDALIVDKIGLPRDFYED